MKKIVILVFLLIALVVTGYLDKKSQTDWKMISPFTAVSFEGEAILVEFQNNTYELVSIGGVVKADLVTAAKRRFGRKWQKRIREDIAEVLEAAGAPEGNFVELILKESETGLTKTFIDAKMTKTNRAKIKNPR